MAKAETEKEKSEARETAPASPPEQAPKRSSGNSDDDFIDEAREAARNFSSGLRNYLAEQATTRYYSQSNPPRWQQIDVVTAEVVSKDGNVKTRTLANITHLASRQIESLRTTLSGSLPATATSLPDSFPIARSLPHGHVAAVPSCLRSLQLDSILDRLGEGRRVSLVHNQSRLSD